MPNDTSIKVELFDGTRHRVSPDFRSRYTIYSDINKRDLDRYESKGASLRCPLVYHDNFRDYYQVIVSADGCDGSGYSSIHVEKEKSSAISLMLLSKTKRYRFTGWGGLDPAVRSFLSAGLSSTGEALQRHDELADGPDLKQDILAAIHNFTTTLKSTMLDGASLFSRFRQLDWNAAGFDRDRFYAYADARLLDSIRNGGKRWEKASTALHGGASFAFKETTFENANLELVFFESDRKKIDGLDCLRVEVDIDYYRDKLTHFFFEVVRNEMFRIVYGADGRAKTDPKAVYMLRWIVERNDGDKSTEFDPPYTLS